MKYKVGDIVKFIGGYAIYAERPYWKILEYRNKYKWVVLENIASGFKNTTYHTKDLNDSENFIPANHINTPLWKVLNDPT